jgi:hypothetical protein
MARHRFCSSILEFKEPHGENSIDQRIEICLYKIIKGGWHPVKPRKACILKMLIRLIGISDIDCIVFLMALSSFWEDFCQTNEKENDFDSFFYSRNKPEFPTLLAR